MSINVWEISDILVKLVEFCRIDTTYHLYCCNTRYKDILSSSIVIKKLQCGFNLINIKPDTIPRIYLSVLSRYHINVDRALNHAVLSFNYEKVRDILDVISNVDIRFTEYRCNSRGYNVIDSYAYDPLLLAIRANNSELISIIAPHVINKSLILYSGCLIDVYEYFRSPLFRCIEYNSYHALNTLLKYIDHDLKKINSENLIFDKKFYMTTLIELSIYARDKKYNEAIDVLSQYLLPQGQT